MTFKLNVSGLTPYKKMGTSCELKNIDEFRVPWPKLTATSDMSKKELVMRYMRGDEIDAVIELWKNVYPEVYGSTHQIVFDPNWYDGNVLFDENWATDAKDMQYAILLMEDLKVNSLFGILLMTKWNQNLQVELTMGGLHSEFREKQIFYPFFKKFIYRVSVF